MLWRIWPSSEVDLLEFYNDMKWRKFQSPADLLWISFLCSFHQERSCHRETSLCIYADADLNLLTERTRPICTSLSALINTNG